MVVRVSTWKNGRPNLKSGAGFGIRIPKKYVKDIKKWECIKFENYKEELSSNRKLMTELCPEIRSQVIGRYLKLIGKTKWDSGKPHKLELRKIKGTNNKWILKKSLNK
jgi:hypothetical protein